MRQHRFRVVVTCRAFPEIVDHLGAIAAVDVNRSDAVWAREELARRASGADALMVFMPDRIDADFLARCGRLRVVACALKGYDNIDVAACTAASVWVTIVPDLLTAPTAELAVGLTIGLARRIRDGDALVRSGAFAGWRPVLYGRGLDGATVAIVGMGRLGTAIARRLEGFGCRLLGVDPEANMPAAAIATPLNEALLASDFVIVAAPLMAQTRHLIDGHAIAAMKPGALLVNIGRGSVIDETAVLQALETGQLGGYAADVFEMEDRALSGRPCDIDPRLRTHARTLFTPHLGSAVKEVRRQIELRAAENIVDVLEGRRPRDAINNPARVTKAGAA